MIETIFNQNYTNSIIIKYLQLGLSPIPLRGKVANYHWKEFTLKEGDIIKYAGYNWGLRAGLMASRKYIYFVDLDSKERIADLYNANPDLLKNHAPVVSSGRGFHIYLAWTQQPQTRHYPRSDVVGNGYVVCPPSVHPETHKPYRFVRPLTNEIPLYDPNFLDLGTGTRNTQSEPPNNRLYCFRSQQAYKHSVSPIKTQLFNWWDIRQGVSEGSRHTTLIRYLGILHSQRLDGQEALEKVLVWNSRCRPPLPHDEVLYQVKACYAKWSRESRLNNGPFK